MIKNSLRTMIDQILEKRLISDDDVRLLQRDILPNGPVTIEDVDVLIALDRAVPRAVDRWADYLVASVVDHVVWASRPTGYVDAATARWLVASLTAGSGPTPNAVRIAFEIVREAEQVDEALTAFVMAAVPAERSAARSIVARMA